MPRILIVDDHPLVRQGLKAGLSKAPDLKVIGEAETADEALTEARNQRPDIILLDISLPGRNGFEVLRQLHAEMPEVRILMLSTYSEKQYAVRCLRNGAWGYLTKKSSSDELIDAVRTVMQGRKYITSSLAQLLASEVSADSAKLPHEDLSDREFQILCLIGQGKTVAQIAEILSIGTSTVGTHRVHIFEKMNMHSTVELVRYALENKLVDNV